MKYLVWESRDMGSTCTLNGLQGVEDVWQLNEGVSRIQNFGEDAHFDMDQDRRKKVALADSLINPSSLVVISEKLMSFLSSKEVLAMEYLPARIIDHKGRTAATYYVAHPVLSQDCLDPAASGAVMSFVDTQEVETIRNLVIDESRVDPRLRIFRMTRYVMPVLIERRLAEEISAAGFTGVNWVELADYGK